MKLKTIAAALLIAASCASAMAQTPFQDHQTKVYAARDKGLITYTEAEQEMLSAAIALAPEDKPLHMLIEHLIEDAKKFDAGTVSKDEYFAKRTARIDRYNELTAIRNQQIIEANQRAQPSGFNRFMQILGGAASNVNRNMQQQQGQNCVYVANGNVMTKQCY